jgi:hypothetical protein
VPTRVQSELLSPAHLQLHARVPHSDAEGEGEEQGEGEGEGDESASSSSERAAELQQRRDQVRPAHLNASEPAQTSACVPSVFRY